MTTQEFTAKQQAIEAIESLADDVEIDEIIEQLQFLASVEAGLAQLDAGQSLSHAEVRRRMARSH